jgi:hypothetical protein
MGVLFLLNSDQRKYGSMTQELSGAFARLLFPLRNSCSLKEFPVNMMALNNSPCKLKLTFPWRAQKMEELEEFKDSSKD